MVKLSVLDLCPVGVDYTVRQALANSISLAAVAEGAGYERLWYAEHHNMPGIASAATSVLINAVAANTRKIRLGSGGIMLPNHSPLSVAEAFGTLVQLYGPRFDLGVGRAPGTDPRTMRALRRNEAGIDTFAADVSELLSYFGPYRPGEVNAVAAVDTNVPVWILGSSNFGAELAALYGLPYSFAAHFAPEMLAAATELYRSHFRPSPYLRRPYLVLAVNMVLAADAQEAHYQFTSSWQSFLNLLRNKPAKIAKPCAPEDLDWSAYEEAAVLSRFKYSFIGTPRGVEAPLREFMHRYKPDELMLVSNIYDQATRENTLKLAKEINLS